MSSQSQGSEHSINAIHARTSLDKLESTDGFSGFGILSVDPAVARTRLYTLDSFNISPIEPSQYARPAMDGSDDTAFGSTNRDAYNISSDNDNRSDLHDNGNLEKATWEFSDILQSLSVKDKDDLHGIISKCNQLVPHLANHPSLRCEIVIENVLGKIQFMLYDPRSQVRSAAYRLLRHSVATADALLFLVHLKILIFIIVSLSTPTPLLEKEQALKLVREFINIPGGVQYLSVGIIKALVSYIEYEHDETQLGESDLNASHESYGFTRMCIETVSEISVLYPDIVFHGGGLRLLINLAINGSVDISIACLPTLLTLLDMPHSRLFLRNGADLHCLMSVFTLFEDDEDEIKALHTRRYHTKALKMSFILSCLLKTWSGLVCFSHDNFDPIKMLLSNLRKRNSELCSIILDLLLDILRIQTLPWLQDSSIGDLLTLVHSLYHGTNKGDGAGISFDYQEMDRKSFEYGVISHYQGLLTKVLVNCGLVPLLFKIVNEDRNDDNTNKATFLLTSLFDLASKFLPPEFYERHIMEAYNTDLSLTSLSKIEAATKMRQTKVGDVRNAEVRIMVRDLTRQMRADMKDHSFKALVAGTKLLTLKDFDEWNWSLLSQVFQGPLRNPLRFTELQEKYPKFLKTFLSFLRPFKYRFSSIPLTASSKHPKIHKPKTVILVACQLIEGLLATEEGSTFLSSNKLMLQIAKIFAQLDPYSDIAGDSPMLSKPRLYHSLSLGYVKMVGIMSGLPRGTKILEYWQLFSMMSNIIESSVNDEANNYLILNILENLDYTRKGHARIILAKAMSISNWKVKVDVIDNVFPQLSKLEGCEELYVLSLVNLLYYESEAVVGMAVECLYDYFIVNDNLELIDLLVECRPSISILELREQGQSLIYSLCTTSNGFKYLDGNNFIEEYFMTSIEQLKSLEYLTAVEDCVRNLLFPFSPSFTNRGVKQSPTSRHFFHYLLSTEEGLAFINARRSYIDEAIVSIRGLCRMLNIIEGPKEADDSSGLESHSRASEFGIGNSSVAFRENLVDLTLSPGDLKHLPPSTNWAKSAESALDNGSPPSKSTSPPHELSDQDDEYWLKRLKQYIWIVGEIASATYGIQVLEPVYSSSPNSEHIAETLSLIFEQAGHWQLRGLAFLQLGKMSGTAEGVEILDNLKWISFESRQQFEISLAYPKFMQVEGFTKVEELNPYKDVSYYSLFGKDEDIHVNENLNLEDEIVIESYEEIDEKILSLFNYLSSVLGRIERKAIKELSRIKASTPQVFDNIGLFLKTIRLIDKGKFKYRTRSFIFELFSTMKIMEGLVKRDKKNSSVRRQAV